ncbi:MAG: gamma-glutamyl-gamma-aminobutyrate hydrolase family protein [Burkholderiales bacterium]|nr:gamma-glutamyl-gamma-aminobutyrate hydrolase family protein [Burkholderiales bacterium]
MSEPPIVLVTSCNRLLGDHPFHLAGRKYVDAVRLAGALPLIAPPFAEADLATLLGLADGVLLTGSQSNVHPSHYGEAVYDPTLPLDPDRDAWTLPLVNLALARGVPLFGICRGTQEANVALGGNLHQAVHAQPGLADHRAPRGQRAERQYAPAHRVNVVAGGLLEALVGEAEFEVNSVHGQGINRLAEGLRVEARAPDGLVEAFSAPKAPGFNLFVQWHPEWRAAANPISLRLFQAFGDAVRVHRQRRRTPATAPIPA